MRPSAWAWPLGTSGGGSKNRGLFAVPLAELAAIEPDTRVAELKRYRRLLYSYPWGEYLIWGFTGNVVRDLLEAASAPGADEAGEAGASDPFEPR